MKHMTVTSNLGTKTNKQGNNCNHNNNGPHQPPTTFRLQGYDRGQVERPPLVLGQQPPLLGPNKAKVNFSLPNENPWEQLQDLVTVKPYAEEINTSPIVEAQEYQYMSQHASTSIEYRNSSLNITQQHETTKTKPKSEKDML